MAQRPLRRQGIPVRCVEHGEGQCEGGVWFGRIVLGLRAQRGEARVQFHADAQQQHVAFERGQAEAIGQHGQRGDGIAAARRGGRLRRLGIRIRQLGSRRLRD